MFLRCFFSLSLSVFYTFAKIEPTCFDSGAANERILSAQHTLHAERDHAGGRLGQKRMAPIRGGQSKTVPPKGYYNATLDRPHQGCRLRRSACASFESIRAGGNRLILGALFSINAFIHVFRNWIYRCRRETKRKVTLCVRERLRAVFCLAPAPSIAVTSSVHIPRQSHKHFESESNFSSLCVPMPVPCACFMCEFAISENGLCVRYTRFKYKKKM